MPGVRALVRAALPRGVHVLRRTGGAQWYACRDAGGRWPMMHGPYDEERARLEAAHWPDGWAIGFATNADRGDFLRRYEDAGRDGTRAELVQRLQAAGRPAGRVLPWRREA